jgi:DMSO/TMAO reductase YedYZ molybdopterin-dependent catalytic subunit
MAALDGGTAALAANQVSAEESLVALLVNGVPLSLDHGYPARVIVPGEVAVNCLKWVHELSFREAPPRPAPSHSTMPGMGQA